jgi:hypothetical protein
MSIDTPYSLAQLAQILSALEGERRNPNTRRNATKAIERAAMQLGLSAEDVFDAADGLLIGRVDAAAWRAQLGGACDRPATFVAEALPIEPAADHADAPVEADILPDADRITVAPKRRGGTRPESKQALLIAMLRRDEGATIEQIVEATGWQRHTCRGAISGALKKRLGLAVISGKIDGRRVYRIGD